MEEFEGLALPPVGGDVEVIQEAHCTNAQECVLGECEGCLYYNGNLEKFTNWYYQGRNSVKVESK